jgi:hypothetical protein
VSLLFTLRPSQLPLQGVLREAPRGKEFTFTYVWSYLDGQRVLCRVVSAVDGEGFPLLHITLQGPDAGRAALEVCRRLRRGTPPVYVGHRLLHQGTLLVHPMHLDDRAADTLARRLLEELARE